MQNQVVILRSVLEVKFTKYCNCAAENPMDRSMVPESAKVGATSMPNDTFWATKLTTSAPKIMVNCKTSVIETASRHRTNFSREMKINIEKQQAKVKGPAAWAKP